MFFWIVIVGLFLLVVVSEYTSFKKFKLRHAENAKNLFFEKTELKKKSNGLTKEMEVAENNLTARFLFYDLSRKIAPLLDKQEIFNVFSENLRRLGDIEEIKITEDQPKNKGWLEFKIGKKHNESVYIKTKSKITIQYTSYFINLLNLCLEKLKFYNKLQKLSIHDSLTKVYNRRYFMQRYIEEFNRARKFRLNLSFLMIDIDNFKKINDMYGHLVGDAVLREVARTISQNTREIDFIARFGGEEFSVILLETEKSGAIMVAERMRSKISRKKIEVFDEILRVEISIGLASFPQNTIHPDVLLETADKALYKAKIDGKNRVRWF